MQLADAPMHLESMGLRQTMHRVRAWLKKFTATEGETGSADASGCEPAGGAESSSTLVDVPSSSNTCSPSPSERQQKQHLPEQVAPPPQQQHGQQQGSAQQQQAPSADKVKSLVPDTRDFFAEYGEANRYLIREVIGKGSYGIVCSAVDQFTGERVAIKKITNVFEHVSDATRILREIKLLRMLKHPDIVDIKHIMLPPSARDFKDIYVVFELMETDLHQVIKANDDLTPDHHQFFLYQMLRGLKYIHSAKVFHRDLKPKNILANSDCKLKICDFGLARPAFNDVPTAILWTDYVATRWYRAPELCGSFFAKYSPAIDIWSVGCIFAEVLLGKPLFPGKNVAHQLEIITDLLGTPSPHVLDKVRNEKARRFLMAMRPKPGIPFQAFFPRAAPGALALLRRMLAFDPAERPTAEEALADPYFAGLHSPSREPIAQPISKLAFEFDRRKLEMGDVRELIYREILEYHPQVLRSHLGHGMRSAFVNPSSLDNFTRQFMHLEANPGAVIDIRGSAAVASAAPGVHQSSNVPTSGAYGPRAPLYNFPTQNTGSSGSLQAPDSHSRRGDQEAAAAEAHAARERLGHSGHSMPPQHPPYPSSTHTAAQQQQARATQLQQQQQAQQMHTASMYAVAQQHAAQLAQQQQQQTMQGAHYMQLVMQQQQAQQAAAQVQWAHHHASSAQAGAPSWAYDTPQTQSQQPVPRDRSLAGKDRHLQSQISAPAPAGSEAFLTYNNTLASSANDSQELSQPSPMVVDAGSGASHHLYAQQQQAGGGSASSQGSTATLGMSGNSMEHVGLCGTSVHAASAAGDVVHTTRHDYMASVYGGGVIVAASLARAEGAKCGL